MTPVRLYGSAAVALARAGLVGGLRPAALPGLVRALRRTGSSPAALVAVAAAACPDRTAIIDDEGALTFAELDAASIGLAAGLLSYTGEAGAVAVMGRNHRGVVLAILAAARIGADLLLVNAELSRPQALAVLEASGPAVVLVDPDLVDRVDGAGLPLVAAAWEAPASDLPTLRELCGVAPSPQRPRRPSRRGRITILSSGTTGAPKRVSRSPGPLALLSPLVTILRRTRLRAGEPLIVAVPLFHGFGIGFWVLAAVLRSPVVLRRRFDAAQALDDAQRHGAAALVGVPVMLQRLLALPEGRAPAGLHTVVSGGAALRPELAARFQDAFGDVLFNGYGSSEAGVVSIATPADLRAVPGTVGRPCDGTPVEIRDGVICVGGPGIMADHADRFVRTGDLGHFDAAGRLFVTGRADDMIVSGGENVYPGEVEDVLVGHPAVAEAAVVGVDDAEFGQRLVAYVVAAGGEDPDPAALAAHVRDSLARYKVPRAFVVVAELPRNAMGKVLVRELRERG